MISGRGTGQINRWAGPVQLVKMMSELIESQIKKQPGEEEEEQQQQQRREESATTVVHMMKLPKRLVTVTLKVSNSYIHTIDRSVYVSYLAGNGIASIPLVPTNLIKIFAFFLHSSVYYLKIKWGKIFIIFIGGEDARRYIIILYFIVYLVLKSLNFRF